jgi:DNA-binding MarR family transcriptional regulator
MVGIEILDPSGCQRAGLLARTPDPDDGRGVRVFLTPLGEERITRILQRNVLELDRLELQKIDDALREFLRETVSAK